MSPSHRYTKTKLIPVSQKRKRTLTFGNKESLTVQFKKSEKCQNHVFKILAVARIKRSKLNVKLKLKESSDD